ncbi:MAG: hypothetical protein DCC58_20555 [Chloroflexi bacterium]|nr:MAG: hypothetical protein DCC58_20555 [Chloroflexota bacterium]
MVEEPELPWRMWDQPDSHWPVTAWPAFEAVKCAEQQSLALTDELDWRLRHAFFAESRCIALRHEILACAEAAGLEMARFTHDFDSGVVKGQVIAEAREGWERLQVNGSPTLVFPNGTQAHGQELGLPEMTISANRVLAFTPGARDGIRGSEALARTLERRLAG